MKRLRGVVTPITTCFNEDGSIFTDGIRKEIDFLLERGVNGLYPCGTVGESFYLTVEDRRLIAETVVSHTNRRATVFIQVGAPRIEDVIELAQHAYKIGADGIGCINPGFNRVTEEAQEAFYIRLANSVPEDFPVYMYNCPGATGNDIPPSVCEHVAEVCPNVIGMKYSGVDFKHILDYMKIRNGTFSVLVGNEPLMLPNLMMGGDGVVSGVSNAFPELFCNIYTAYCQRDLAKAKEAMWQANDACKMFWGPHTIKAVLKLRGVDTGSLHHPFVEMSAEKRAVLEASAYKVINSLKK